MNRIHRAAIGWLLVSSLIGVGVLAGSGAAWAEETEWGAVIGPVTATSLGLRLPTTAEEVARFTPNQIAQLEAKIYARLPQVVSLIESGEIKMRILAQGPSTRRTGNGRLAAPVATDVYTSYGCAVAYTDTTGGSWMKGGAWTQTTLYPYQLLERGDFYKGGTKQNNWQTGCSGGCSQSRTEGWGDLVWKWWYESYTWTTNSWHNQQYPQSHYNLGPDQFCTVSTYY